MASTGSGLRTTPAIAGCALLGVVTGGAAACGARSGLETSAGAGGSEASVSSSSSGSITASSSSASSSSSSASSSSSSGCVDGATQVCGSDVGACMYGEETCAGGVFGACVGGVGPKPEACTGIDENCNGTVNDCDPGSGTCTPTLLCTGSTPSSPNCIDFPVMKGSEGSFTYTCPGTGGEVTAVLGNITFDGSVTDNYVTLDGYVTISPPETPDGCTWQDHHHIEGLIQSLSLAYTYHEMVIASPPGASCWSPCTETGSVQIIFP